MGLILFVVLGIQIYIYTPVLHMYIYVYVHTYIHTHFFVFWTSQRAVESEAAARIRADEYPGLGFLLAR